DGEAAVLDREIDVVCHHQQLRLFSTERKTMMRPIMAPEIPLFSPLVLTVRDLRYKLYNLFQ
ncbi:MAG: hypothetical protein K2J05_02030, partial [Muribaculaceae bacterium]|nr:hypothetical protein [Muribaculaceae bacterium]